MRRSKVIKLVECRVTVDQVEGAVGGAEGAVGGAEGAVGGAEGAVGGAEGSKVDMAE